MNITEENCKQLVYDYGEENYRQEFTEAAGLFPYDNSGLPADLELKNVVEWFLFEWVNPATGKTIVREFVEKSGVPGPLAGNMLKMEKPLYSKFRVLSVNRGNGGVELLDTKTGKKYSIVKSRAIDTYKAGQVLRGRIHEWEDAWRFMGITTVRPSEEEIEEEMFARSGFVSPGMLMRHFEGKKMAGIDGVIIGAKTTIYGLLDKYPAHWIDGICDTLGVEREGVLKRDKIRLILEKINSDTQAILAGLSEEEKKCLKVIADAGGMVKYGKLLEFSDEMPYWWTEHGVNSTIGKLRAKGLLYVGKTMMGGRFCKMALIPRELVPKILGQTSPV